MADAKHDLETASPAEQIDAKIRSLSDWRGEALARMRRLIKEADPDVVETIKWRKPSNPAGVPVWEHDGIICTGDAFKGYVKLTFGKGALLPDPFKVFNASLDGNAMRAINIYENDQVNEQAFKQLFLAAVALNTSKTKASAGEKR